MKPDIETRLRGANPLPRDQQLEQLYGHDLPHRLLADVLAKKDGRMTDVTDRRQPETNKQLDGGDRVTRLTPDRIERSRRRGPGLAFVAAALVIAVGGIAGLMVLRGGEPDVAQVPEDPVGTATAFVLAYTGGDVEAAGALLAADAFFDYNRLADTGAFSGDFSDLGVEGLALIARLDEAVGMVWLPGECEVQGTTSTGTSVVCPYDFHGFHSDVRGLGPYSGSAYRITVVDGKVTSFIDRPYPADGDAWVAENWDPFNTWVSETHPEDWATLSDEEAIGALLTSAPEQAIEMYQRLVQGFVEHETQGS